MGFYKAFTPQATMTNNAEWNDVAYDRRVFARDGLYNLYKQGEVSI